MYANSTILSRACPRKDFLTWLIEFKLKSVEAFMSSVGH